MPLPFGPAVGTIDRALADLALSGLSRPQKTLPAKLFYDDEGCRLFYRITELPEYYLTRTELSLLPDVARHVAALLQPNSVLVEYGASDESKAAFLLAAESVKSRRAISAYVPVDVARLALTRMRDRLAHRFPSLAVHPVVADFMDPVVLPEAVAALPRVGFFPGSTIGNLDPPEAGRFLRLVRAALGESALLLVGSDLRKDPSIVLPAYNDAEGVTATFNRNVLVRLNREAGADFDPAGFDHRAIWNDADSRIEMHLVSRCPQTVHICGQRVDFLETETIHTENSYKYAPETFKTIAAGAGWHVRQMWTDPKRLFALYLLAVITST